MRRITWIMVGLIIIITVGASISFFLPQQLANATTSLIQMQNLTNTSKSNEVNILVKTDGSSTTVEATSIPETGKVPDKMLAEMKNKAHSDVLSDSGTANSLKADMKKIAQKYNYTATVTVTSQFGTDQLPFPATVDGDSMLPTLHNGQNVVAIKTSSFKVGDIVIARHPSYGLIIKRVAAIKSGKVFLKSDNRKVENITTETPVSDGVTAVETITKTPLDAWLPVKNVVGVVKI